VDLLDGERHEQHPHDDGQADDRPRPRQPDLVQPVEDVPQQVLERRQETGDDHVNTR
jgi:hypothetical protein